jgi:hypothetical protein
MAARGRHCAKGLFYEGFYDAHSGPGHLISERLLLILKIIRF